MHTLSCLWWELPGSIFNTEGLPFSDRFWRSFLRLAGDGDILPVLSPPLNRADWWGGWHYNQIFFFYITLQLRPKDCNNIYEALHTAIIPQSFILTQDQKGGRSCSDSFIIIGNDDTTLEASAVLYGDLC